MVTFETSFQVRSHGAICSACDSSFTHEFLWNCSHSAMGLDAICNVLTLELHIAIAQNGYEAHSCVTSHTSMHRTQSNHTMWTVSLTTTQSNFCILKIAVAHGTVWTSPSSSSYSIVLEDHWKKITHLLRIYSHSFVILCSFFFISRIMHCIYHILWKIKLS